MGAVREELAARLGTQTHLLRFWDELSEDERNVFAAQLDKIDVQECLTAFNESAHIYVPNPDNLEPIPAERHIVADDLNAEERQRLFQLGLESISRGELCCLVLAGGQASRLGSSEPKGTIPLGIDVAHGDSLLALQAAKIACLERLARESFPGTSGRIQWVVMTSLGTEKATLLHLNKIVPANGLSMDQVIVFSQDNIPAFDMEGNLLLSRKDEVSTAPNGNGGLYSALSHHLPTLQSRGVRYVQTYCVDNILCRVGDPAMLGMVIDKNADCAAKTVEKYVGELVGSITLDDGKPRVTEYSELGEKLASRVGPDGKLLFRAGNIAIHMFTMEFLESFSSPKFHLPYHRALKKITYVNEDGDIVKPEKPNGIKLEQFIFDVFPLSKNFFVWEVKREDEFSPLKNAESAGKDCLSSCVRDLSAQSIRWLHSAGAVIPPGQEVFLAAARSYAGEGLEEFSNKQIEERILF